MLRPFMFFCACMLAGPSLAQDGGATAELEGLQWALSTNGADVSWGEARDWCEALELRDSSDWRLPTLEELESVHVPEAGAEVHIADPLPRDTCCLWSSTTLEERPREEDDFYIGPSLDAARYSWGFLYSEEGLRYYSAQVFPDGQALCVRQP